MQKIKRRRSGESPMDIGEPVAGCSKQPDPENVIINENMEIGSDDEEGGFRVGDIYIPPAPKPALTFNSTGPRLVITHIRNENFKSYAGVQYLGPFHKCFTSIIGPNGSGKSNVIDSMLFVFGYRASKIRSKKISVLIHSSSKEMHCTSATVSVHFSQIIDGEGDDFTIVPNSEIVVSRTAFKDSSSIYTLNGKRVLFKEVAKMLRSFGIDLDNNRFLILQGEVEQIAMMKPKAQTEHETGMLEYLEDIIGTARYKEPLIKLFDKVEEYCSLRKEKLTRVRFVEAEKMKLQEPMKEAIELINLTNASLRTKNMLLQKYCHETDKLIQKKQGDIDELRQTINDISNQLEQITQELVQKTDVLNTGMQKYDDLQQQKEKLSEELSNTKRKMVTVVADTTQAVKKKKNLEQLIEQEKAKLIDLELIPEKNAREIEECNQLLVSHNETKINAEEELQTTVAGVREQTQHLQENKDGLQSRLIDLKKIVDDCKSNYKLAESEFKIYLNTEEKETEKLRKMRDAHDRDCAALEEKNIIAAELTASVPENENNLNVMQMKLQQYKQEEGDILPQVRTLRSSLEEHQQAMRANKSRGRVLDSLMKEKQVGNIPGIFGRLGDLGGIDSRYDVAISTCCGALDNIVVDSVDTAQACIEHLRQHNIGRATFIALDKQRHLVEVYTRKLTYPENAPRLFDLVTVRDERVLPAFYFALRNTLVATDLDQAARLAYAGTRYRVVTLNGDVIEIAGTMSGGGKTIMRGRMSSSVQQDTSEVDPQVMQANETRLTQLESRLSEIRSEQITIEDNVVSLQRTIRDGKTKLNKINIELQSLNEQIPTLTNQINQQERKVAACKVDEKKKSQLESVMQTAERKLKQAQENAGEVEVQVQEIDAQILSVAGNRVKELQKNVDNICKKIDKITTEITKLKVAINTSKRNAKKSKDKITQMETDFKDTVENLENLNNRKKQLSLEVTQLQKDLEQVECEISEGVGEYAGLREELKQLQLNENRLKSLKLEHDNAMTQAEKTSHDYYSKKQTWLRELSSLRLEEHRIEGVAGAHAEPLEKHDAETLEAARVDELRQRLEAQKARIGDKKPNVQAILDFKAKEEVYIKRAAELDAITEKRNEVREAHDTLKKRRHTEFLTGFSTITAKLKEMYQMITLGGDAELELVDSLDPFTEGVSFSVRPPNKSWKVISNLSGGEKTLSSLALVFALHYYRPTPLYVMDEIDAALDFKNVSIVANYIKERTRNAQFIIISLRYNMFEMCNRLVGIYKTEDCTKSVTVENRLPTILQLRMFANNS